MEYCDCEDVSRELKVLYSFYFSSLTSAKTNTRKQEADVIQFLVGKDASWVEELDRVD